MQCCRADIGSKECNILSEDGVSLIGGSFESGPANHNWPPPQPRGVHLFEKVVVVLIVVGLLAVLCAACFAFVLRWSKRDAVHGLFGIGLVHGIDNQRTEILIKQLVGFVAMRLVCSVVTIAVSGLAIAAAPKPAGDQQGTDYMSIIGWGIAIPFALCIPTCGYCGAKERHRWTLGIFVAFNALSAIWSSITFALALLSLSDSSDEDVGAVAVTTLLITLQALSIVISAVNGIAGYRLWDQASLRGSTLGAALIHPQTTSFVAAPVTALDDSSDCGPASSARDWSVSEVSQWLVGEMKLGEISAVAAQEQIDGSIAAEMGADAWRELGATAIQAARLVAAFKLRRAAE
jgi:hypothetical protein